MNEADDLLEAELAALKPQPVSPGLRRRVADRLDGPILSRYGWPWGLGLAGGAAAACLATALLLRPEGGREAPPGTAAVLAPSAAAKGEGEPLPTLQAYRRALARSPEELAGLLDRHVTLVPGTTLQPVAVRAFTRSDEGLGLWLGEP